MTTSLSVDAVKTRTPQEVKTLLVAALRSGEYVQGVRQLCDDWGRMCPLGVLYDLAVKDGGAPWSHISAEAPFLPRKFQAFLIGTLPPLHLIAWRNDQGHTFAQIAHYIERYDPRGKA